MLITKKVFLYLIMFCFLLEVTACNNGNYNAVPSNPATSNPSVPSDLSGVFTSIIYPDSATLGMQSAYAVFFPTPGDTVHTRYIGGVKINTLNMDVDTPGYSLYNLLQPSLDMTSTSDWQVIGDTIIPSFSYSHHVPFPVFTGTLPDSINHNNGFSITINSSNLSGADSVAVIIGVDTTGHSYAGNYSASAGTITFTASDLVNIVPGLSFIQLIAYKKTTQTFSGKKFLFTKEAIITKSIWVQ